MFESISIAASALRTAQIRQGVSAHNVANALTSGFRAQRVEAASVRSGGVSVGAIRSRGGPGAPQSTGQPLDLAIQGNGFFALETPQGPRFSRAGAFGVDAQGQIVDSEGNRLAGDLTLPPGARGVSVGGDGTVTAILADGSTEPIGQIELARFPNPEGLVRSGGNRLAATAASGDPAFGPAGVQGRGTIVSGFLEGSNVDLVTEMVDQIVNRAFFRANLATIRTESELLGDLVDLNG